MMIARMALECPAIGIEDEKLVTGMSPLQIGGWWPSSILRHAIQFGAVPWREFIGQEAGAFGEVDACKRRVRRFEAAKTWGGNSEGMGGARLIK